MVQTAQTALCGVCHQLEPRLACWLSLACDALQHNVVPVTHENLSTILGMRRAGITEALNRFGQSGLLRKTRGVLEISNRNKLQSRACVCYRIVSRLIGDQLSGLTPDRHARFVDGQRAADGLSRSHSTLRRLGASQ
ncbi:helix-turn-helix domain-containing protein [Bradyrhizobium sp. Cp5.3]|uniref:helix-turn-helix domain-containing protein n=1 Tax=Bradyrhizobium sp. Cp5.3 TaxID=443598 RepID=UPI003528BE2B